MGQLPRHRHWEQAIVADYRDSASARILSTVHAGTGRPKIKAPAVSAGTWQLHPSGGAERTPIIRLE